MSSYYLQTRTDTRTWETVGKGTQNEDLALRRLRALAETSYPHVTLRVMTGNPYAGLVETVLATRPGCAARD